MEIEAKGELTTDGSVRFGVRPTTMSIWTIGLVTAALLLLGAYNLLVLDPPNTLAWGVLALVPFLLAWYWIRFDDLAQQTWPGLSAFVRRIVMEHRNSTTH